ELVIRHYKTDWWGERQVVWRDAEPYPDAEPLAPQLRLLLEAEYAGRVTVVNPFGAVLSQNKLTLALLWEEQERFSPLARRWIRRYFPRPFRWPKGPQHELRAHGKDWVLKSVYGWEGKETICGPFVSAEPWCEAVTKALPPFWVCQRFFHAAAEPQGALCNYGVYLIGGRSAGFFTRLAAAATDAYAVTAPTFIAARKGRQFNGAPPPTRRRRRQR